MKKPGHLSVVAVAMLGSVWLQPAASAIDNAPYPLELWSQPAFKRMFLGQYGILSDVEPSMSEIEKQQMAKISDAIDKQPEDCYTALSEITTEKSSPQFHFVLGNLSYQTRRPHAQTLQHYAAAVKDFPRFRRAYYAMGRVFTEEGQFVMGVRALSKAVELGQADATVFGLLGFCHLALEHGNSAEEAYRMAVMLQPETRDWKMGLIRSLLKQSKMDEVISLCDEMLASEPGRAEIWSLQANAYIGKRDLTQAAINFEILHALGQTKVPDLIRLGDIYVNEEMPDAALIAYTRAMNAPEPLAVKDALRAMEVLISRNYLDQARELLGQVKSSRTASMPKDELLKVRKVDARISVTSGQSEDAMRILKQVVEEDPLDGAALMQLADLSKAAGDNEQAKLWLIRAEAIDNVSADALVRRAQLLISEGKLDEALPLLDRSLQAKPRDNIKLFADDIRRRLKTKR